MARAAAPARETSARTAHERETLVLKDDEILQLARWAVAVERHYGRPMDMEWAKDGDSDEIYHRAGAAGDGAVGQVRHAC